MKAACNGHTEIALALLKAGADVHTAAKVGQLEHYLEPGILILVLDSGPSLRLDFCSYLVCLR
jgi:hypothetical protein